MSAPSRQEGERRPQLPLSEQSRLVLRASELEAIRFNHNYIGTEHLLLGLIGAGVLDVPFERMGIASTNLLGKTRLSVEYMIGHGDRTVEGEVQLTPRVKECIKKASDDATRGGTTAIEPIHLLRGLLIEGEGIGPGILEGFGISLDELLQATETGKVAEILSNLRGYLRQIGVDQRTAHHVVNYVRTEILTGQTQPGQTKKQE